MLIEKITIIQTENNEYIYFNDQLQGWNDKNVGFNYLDLIGEVARGQKILAINLEIEEFYDYTGTVEKNRYSNLQEMGNYLMVLTKI